MDFYRCFRCALLASSFAVGNAAQAATPANVVFITIDTLRPDHLGCYGDKQIRTPNIDALAADGTRFERAYTAVPVTLPSHTVIFTGTYPMLSGVHDFAANKLSPNQPTLASVLRKEGYTTGAVIGSAVLDSRFGLNHGFDFYYDHFDFNRLQESNLDEMERPGNVVADLTLDWLSKNYQKKFFLWMHLYDPHYPYRPPPPYSEQYKDRARRRSRREPGRAWRKYARVLHIQCDTSCSTHLSFARRRAYKNGCQPSEFGRFDADGSRSSKHPDSRTSPRSKPTVDHLPEERRQRPQPVCRDFPSAPAL